MGLAACAASFPNLTELSVIVEIKLDGARAVDDEDGRLVEVVGTGADGLGEDVDFLF